VKPAEFGDRESWVGNMASPTVDARVNIACWACCWLSTSAGGDASENKQLGVASFARLATSATSTVSGNFVKPPILVFGTNCPAQADDTFFLACFDERRWAFR